MSTQSKDISESRRDHIPRGDTTTTCPSDDMEFTPKEQRQIMRRVDVRVVATVSLLYCFSVIDRSNLPSAAVAGMTDDLKLTGNRYSIVSLVFFTTYTTFQPLSIILARTIGPKAYFTGVTMLCGFIVIGMAFLKQWGQMVALRVILGALDSGFFPTCVYLLSTWYTRYEVGKRYSVFYVLVCLATAFSGILAFGLTKLDGKGNLSGWSWIFLMEGVITCFLGLIGYFLLVGFPDADRTSWRFLSQREIAWVIARVQQDRGDATLPAFSIRKFLRGGTDAKVWAISLIYFNQAVMNFSLSFFLPIILKENMGFSTGQAQILIAPPYIFAAIIMFISGWLGDRYKVRGPIIIGDMIVAIIGTILVGFHSHVAVRYAGVFLVTGGSFSSIPVVMAYQANNIRGQWKRAFSSCLTIAFGGIGGIAGSLVFRSQDKPKYMPGISTCLGCAVMNIILVLCLGIYFYYWNRKAESGKIELEASEETDASDFRYTF